ncbi:MAG: DMT family transporter [Butyrivibrio sp.]
MLGILIALLSGLLMSVQGVMNTGVTKQTGIWLAAGFVQLSAFIVCVIAWFFTGRDKISGLWQVSPKYMLLGGIIGAFITITVIKSMEILGPAKAVMLIVVMQIVSAYLIELFGIMGTQKVPFSWGKVVGGLISIIGIVIFCLSGENNKT